MGCGSSVYMGFQTLPRGVTLAAGGHVAPVERPVSINVRSASISAATATFTAAPPTVQVSSKPVSNWRESDVRAWLTSLGLGQTAKDGLKGLNGKAVLSMSDAEVGAVEGLNWPDRALLLTAVAELRTKAEREEEEAAGRAKQNPLSKLLLPDGELRGGSIRMVPKSLFSRLRSDSSPVDGAEKAEEGGGGRLSSSSSNTGSSRSMSSALDGGGVSAMPSSARVSVDGLEGQSGRAAVGDQDVEISNEGIQINSWIGDQLVGVEWEDVSESPDIMWAEPTSNVLLGRRLSPVPESPTVSVGGSLDSPGSAPGMGSIPSSPSLGSPGHRKSSRRPVWDLNDSSMLQEQADNTLTTVRRLNSTDNDLITTFAKATGQSYDTARATVQQLLQKTDTTGVAGDLQVAAFLDDTAKLLFSKGYFLDACREYRTALGVRLRHQGRRNREVVGTIRGLADSLFACGKFDDAEALYREAQRSLKRLVGSDHVEVGAVAMRLGSLLAKSGVNEKLAEAEQLVRGALAISRRHNGAHHPITIEGLVALADVLAAQQRLGDAEALYRQGTALVVSSYGPTHIVRASALEGLATILSRRSGVERTPTSFAPQGPTQASPMLPDSEELLEEAVGAVEEAVAIRKELQGEEHPDTGLALYSLAGLLRATRRLSDACACVEAALGVFLPVFGIGHELTGRCNMALGDCFTDLRQYDEAELNYRTALSCFENLPLGHAEEVSSLLSRLAMIADFRGEHPEAERLLRRNLAFCQEVWGDSHPNVAACWFSLATVLEHCESGLAMPQRQHISEAEAALRRAIRLWEATSRREGTGSVNVAMALNNLASLLDREGRYKEAEPLLRKSLGIVRAVEGDVATAQSNLALLLQSRGKFHEAEMLHLSVLEEREKKGSRASQVDIADSLANLAALLRCVDDKRSEAESYLRRCIKIRQKTLGAQHPDTAEAMCELASLLDQHLNQAEEAELLYNSAATGFARAFGTEHPAYVRVQQSLGELYARAGKLSEAEHCLRQGLLVAEGVMQPSEDLHVGCLLVNLAGVLAQMERYAEAELLLLRALHVRKQQEPNLPDIIECHAALGRLYLGWGRHCDAHTSHLQAIVAAQSLGPHHPVTRQLVEEMDGLRDAAPDYLGRGELESNLRAMRTAVSATEEPQKSSAHPVPRTLNPKRLIPGLGFGSNASPRNDLEMYAPARVSGSPRSQASARDSRLEGWAADGWASLVHSPSGSDTGLQDARRPVSAVLTHQTLLLNETAGQSGRGSQPGRARPRSTPGVQLCRSGSEPVGKTKLQQTAAEAAIITAPGMVIST